MTKKMSEKVEVKNVSDSKPVKSKVKDTVKQRAGASSVEESKLVEPNSVEKVSVQGYFEEEDNFDSREVYDDGEMASAYEMGFIKDALKRHQEKLAEEKHPDFDGESCVNCGFEIPVLRLNMGKIRCVHCQEKLEKRKKMYA